MNRFEDKLRGALQREPAPEGMAEKVLARARSLPQPPVNIRERLTNILSWPALRWAGAAAVACLIAVAALVYHHQRQERLRREGAMARAQVIQALRIASVKLNLARRRIQEISQETP